MTKKNILGLCLLAPIFFLYSNAALGATPNKDAGDTESGLKSTSFHPDYGLGNIVYTSDVSEKFYSNKNYDVVEMIDHHAVSYGNSVKLIQSSYYNNDDGQLGYISTLEWDWKKRHYDILMPGDTNVVSGGGNNSKTFYSAYSKNPSVTTISKAVADNVYYGSENQITVSLK
ncbi:MAG: hypothetical protein H0Z34_12980 [Brevibacillus sp.]|nr:hypothetical protein [Brevibacillus sp.]